MKDYRRDFWCIAYAATMASWRNGWTGHESAAINADRAIVEYDRRWTPCEECRGFGPASQGDCEACNGAGYELAKEEP